MLQTSLLLMKSLSKTETPIFLSVVFFVSKGNLFDVYFNETALMNTHNIYFLGEISKIPKLIMKKKIMWGCVHSLLAQSH